MKATGLVQAIILLLLLATAASCEVGKEYAGRVFGSSPVKKIDKTGRRIMETDSMVASNSMDTITAFNLYEKDTIAINEAVIENKKPKELQSTGAVRTKRVRQ
jgi:hypothetical protein